MRKNGLQRSTVAEVALERKEHITPALALYKEMHSVQTELNQLQALNREARLYWC